MHLVFVAATTYSVEAAESESLKVATHFSACFVKPNCLLLSAKV